MDAFLVSAGFPQFENQKHALVGMFLVFAGSLSLPLMRTTKTHPRGRVFVVCRLSSTRKAETCPHGCVSAFCWLPSFLHHANTGNASTGTCFDVGWLLPHPTSPTPSSTYHSDQIPLRTARNPIGTSWIPIGIAWNCSELV